MPDASPRSVTAAPQRRSVRKSCGSRTAAALRRDLRLGPPQPGPLRDGERRHRHAARRLGPPRGAALGSTSARRVGRAARVVPQQRRPQRPAVRVEHHEAVLLAADRDRLDLAPPARWPRAPRAERRPPDLGIGLAGAAGTGHLVGRAARSRRSRRRRCRRARPWSPGSTNRHPQRAVRAWSPRSPFLDTCPVGRLSLGSQHTKARDPAPVASLVDGTSALSDYTPNPEHQSVLVCLDRGLSGSCHSCAAMHASPAADEIVRRPAELGAVEGTA